MARTPPNVDTRSPLEQHLAEAWPLTEWKDVSIVVAVSGGADSIALLCGLLRLKTSGEGRIRVAHFNHRLRGNASDEDESFVAEVCQNFGLPYDIGRAGAQGVEIVGDGLEDAARNARYEF